MKRVFAGFLVLLLLFGGARPANANSAQSYWEGRDQAGIAVTDGDCPIVVQHELLTFDLETIYGFYQESEDAFSTVTAQYTFHNPSDMTVSAKLLFPFGTNPWDSLTVDPETGAYIHRDANKCDILVDGEPVEKNIRHTLYRGAFNVEEDLPLVCDTYVEDPFYTPETQVTLYKFQIEGVDINTYRAACVCFDVPEGMGNRRYYVTNQRGGQIQDDGDMRVIIDATKNAFGLYVFGEPLETMPTFRFYENAGADDAKTISGKATLYEEYDLTFEQHVLANWQETGGVSKVDWYNAAVADFNISTSATHPVVRPGSHNNTFLRDLLYWYEYEITLEPGQTIVNTVTAPIYPSTDAKYEPPVYGFTYLLSPATTWKSFGKLDVVVNTPYYMTDCSLEGFQKTENGYTASFDGLPEEELHFHLSASEDPEYQRSGYSWLYIVLIIVAPFVALAEAFEQIGLSIIDFFRNLF